MQRPGGESRERRWREHAGEDEGQSRPPTGEEWACIPSAGTRRLGICAALSRERRADPSRCGSPARSQVVAKEVGRDQQTRGEERERGGGGLHLELWGGAGRGQVTSWSFPRLSSPPK